MRVYQDKQAIDKTFAGVRKQFPGAQILKDFKS